jgi:hypothetical protein
MIPPGRSDVPNPQEVADVRTADLRGALWRTIATSRRGDATLTDAEVVEALLGVLGGSVRRLHRDHGEVAA